MRYHRYAIAEFHIYCANNKLRTPYYGLAVIMIFIVRRMSYNLSVSPACPEPYLGPSLAQVCPGSQYLTFMTILDALVRTQDSVSQLCERTKPVDPPEYYYDFIVVGGE